jgi:hypothetical protein
MGDILPQELERGQSITTSTDVEMKARDEQHEQAGKLTLQTLLEDEELSANLRDDNVEALRG